MTSPTAREAIARALRRFPGRAYEDADEILAALTAAGWPPTRVLPDDLDPEIEFQRDENARAMVAARPKVEG